jgi:CMP-N,N'-diacetyllegionaminic acid synthase
MFRIENKMSVLAVIPARGGSKGVPKKNMRLLGDKPLVAYAINSVKRSKYIDHLIISTDDEDIVQIGKRLGVNIPFRRPADLASHDAPLIEVVLHAYNFFKDKDIQYDAVICMQPTCPFLRHETIDQVIEVWFRTGCESVVTVSEIINGHPYIAKRLLPDNMIENFCLIPEGAIIGPRQKREKAYYLTGGIYLRDKRLLDSAEPKGHCLGADARAVVVSELEAVDINSEFDFMLAEFLIRTAYAKV